MAWLLILIFLPGVGLVLYFFFGWEKRHRRQISSQDLDELKWHTANNYPQLLHIDKDDPLRDLHRLLWATNKAYPLDGNSAEVYTDFFEMTDNLLKDICEAKDHIHFEFFKFEDDEIGNRIADLLIRKAQEGVKVRMLYDGFSNYSRRSLFKRMQNGGVDVHAFLKVSLFDDMINYRNHRKIVVIDGCIGYLGGMNIAQRYGDGLGWGNWRDTHMRIHGPACSELQTIFLMDWQYTTKERIRESRYYPVLAPTGKLTMQIANSSPLDEWNVIMQGTLRMITQCRRYIYIQSPYMIPTEPILTALRNAALTGVDVRVMIPYRGDHGKLTVLASRSYVKDVTEAGVKVYFYKKGYMHSKAIVADDLVCTIGSTNMDVRSYEQDFEVNAFIYDCEFAVKMREIFLKDQDDCEFVEPEEWKKRSGWEKYKESFARIFSPLL